MIFHLPSSQSTLLPSSTPIHQLTPLAPAGSQHQLFTFDFEDNEFRQEMVQFGKF